MNRTLDLTYFDGSGAAFSPAFSSTDETCTLSGSTPIPLGSIFVRARSQATYQSLFAVVTRQTIVASASARARLVAGAAVRPLRLPSGGLTVGIPGIGVSGKTTAPNAAMWPIVRRYDPLEWSTSAPRTFRLFGPSVVSTTYFVSLAHFSPHESLLGRPTVHQLVTESDYTGAPSHHGPGSPYPLVSGVAGCPGGPMWTTSGSTDLSVAATCDVPNWFFYGYRGSLSVGTDWDPARSWQDFESYPPGQEPPTPLPANRSSCAIVTAYPYLPAPSCPGSGLSTSGDWVETVSGVDETLIANQVLSFVTRYGRDVPASGGGLEKAVVVNVFLWDCGERFDTTQVPDIRSNWTLVDAGGDCSTAIGTFDRVHLLTAVPLTIRESDIHLSGSSRVEATWGNVFSDAGVCAVEPTPAGCGLNPISNSAFLVRDE
jgi:hypothetical protein